MYNIHGGYVAPCTRDNVAKSVGNKYNTLSRRSVGQSGGSNINTIVKSTSTNSNQTNSITHVHPSNIFNYVIENDGTLGISTKDFQEDNGYIVGQSSTGITRVNAPSYKDIEFTINGDPKMMIDSQGKVYINSDDHAVHFSEQLNVNGNIRTNGAYIGSKDNDKGTTMMIGNAQHMTNPNSQETNFSLAHQHDGTTRINSTNALHFAINGNTQMLVNNKGMVGINEINPKASVHIKGNVRVDGDMSVNGTLVSELLTSDQYSNRVKALEQNHIALNTMMATIKSEHDHIKNKVTALEPTVSSVRDMNNKIELFSKKIAQLQNSAGDLQNKIQTMRQKLDSVVNVANIKDVHDIYEQLSLLQEEHSKIDKKITLLMSR